MTDWTSEEDDAFNDVEKHSNLGKQILKEIGQPYHYDVYVSPSQRNKVLEEVAKDFESMRIAFGDTAASFAQYVREMKKWTVLLGGNWLLVARNHYTNTKSARSATKWDHPKVGFKWAIPNGIVQDAGPTE